MVAKKTAAKKPAAKKIIAEWAAPATLQVKTNGSSAAHEAAAIKLLEDSGYDPTEWAVSDYDSYGSIGPTYTFERID